MTYTAAGRYTQLMSQREPYLRRGRDCAKLTIPALLPEDGSTSSTKFYTPYQSLGARGVNNLSSKLLLALVPPQSSFFRLSIDDYALEELSQQEGMRAAVEEALGKIERTALGVIESSALRTVGFEAFKHLVVVGNVLVVARDPEDIRMFRLDKYCVHRAPNGTPLEIIIKEPVSPLGLDDDIRALLPADVLQKANESKVCETVDLYTVVRLKGKVYESYQEISGVRIPDTEETYPKDLCPYLPLRFIRVDGEHYGRSYVEEYYGDLRSLEGLEKAILLGAAAAAKVLFLVNPNGTTREKDVAAAASGDVKSGNANDVTVVQANKSADFSVAKQQADSINNRLAFAFLLNSAIQRSGERVTAEEIRFMARELEDALGGIYSIMAQEFQKPLVALIMHYLRKKRRIPPLPKGAVKPVIVTGMEALGRGQDLARLDEFINGIPQGIAQQSAARLNVGDYLTRRATALGLDQKGLVKTDAQVQEESAAQAQSQMQQTLLDKGTAPAIKMAADAMNQGAAAPAGTAPEAPA